MEGISHSAAVDRLTNDELIFGDKQKVSEIVDGIYEEEDTNVEHTYCDLELDLSFVPVLEKTDIPTIDKHLSVAQSYLYDRGLSEFQIKKYDIRYCYTGRYSGRVVVPCYYQESIVTFVARDITGYAHQKYLNPTANKQGDFLFNYDGVLGERVIVTEGVFDAMAIGDDAVASFGKSLSQRQLNLLNVFSEVIFYWDDDAYEQVERYARKINGVVKTVLHPDALDAGSRLPEENLRIIDDAVLVGGVANTIFSICR
jgi:hypothetical protein